MDPTQPLQPYVPPTGAQPLQPVAPQQPVYAPSPTQPPVPQAVPQPPFAPIPAAQPPSSSSFTPPPVSMSEIPTAAPASDQPQGPKAEIIERLRQANNVLVTVSNNPSVDQLSAVIGTTLMLNKLNKHATAVFSGQVPSTLEFLQPEKTIEKTTDSLRDFIIALDKAKADKLRYKVEDKFVKIFITPYHTSLTEDDLEFSQGDFNVDVVIALGIHRREDLDEAITAHGRILHDAVVACVNNKQTAELGAINWFDPSASSLSEMLVGLIEPLQGQAALLDEQIATAFLTGVVSETERFSNDKTTPLTMNISATLMKAGANQQLVASKLQQPVALPRDDSGLPQPTGTEPAKSKDGALEISHEKESTPAPESKSLDDLETSNRGEPAEDESTGSNLDRIHIDDNGQLQRIAELEDKQKTAEEQEKPASNNMILQPPALGSALSANTVPEVSPPPIDPLAPLPSAEAGMQHGKSVQPLSEEEKAQTLEQIEQAVDSPHIGARNDQADAADVARAKVDALHTDIEPQKPEPTAALNALPVELNKTPEAPAEATALPTQLVPPDPGVPPDPTAGSLSPSAPPPVPPPLIPPDAE